MRINTTRPATDAPEVTRRERQIRFYLSKYREFRSQLDLKKRFAELLWSYPFLTDYPPFLWPAQSPALERQKGDGLLDVRRALQKEALRNIEKQIHRPLARARIQAEKRGEDQPERLDALRTKLDAKARTLIEQVVAIGENYRDDWWLTCQDGASIDRARTAEEEVNWQLGPSWRLTLKRRLKFVDQHYGPLVECEYRDALRRVASLESAFHQECESFWRFLLPHDARYARPRAGKPHPPAKAARQALRQLGIEPNDCTRLLQAWGLKALSPAEIAE